MQTEQHVCMQQTSIIMEALMCFLPQKMEKLLGIKTPMGLALFGPQEILTTSNPSNSVFGIDIDGDGDNDVVSGGVDIVWFENKHPLSINENQLVGVSIYPNPVKDKLQVTVRNNSTIQNIKVYDNAGKKLIEKKEIDRELDLSQLTNGTYLLEVKTENGVFTEKIIKE